MHCTIEKLANDPPTFGVMVFEAGQSRERFDPYFCTCVAVVQDDGVPEVRLWAPPPMDRPKCREVRQAMGRAFVAQGWTTYWRTHPGDGKRIKKPCLPGDECDYETKGA